MPLTITEQVLIIQGTPSPPSGVSFELLVKQAAVLEGKTFIDTYKQFDGEANPLAQAYKNKMLAVSYTATKSDVSQAQALAAVLIAIYAPTGDYATVQGATDAQWESFITNNIFRALEIVSNVEQEEKTAYDAL